MSPAFHAHTIITAPNKLFDCVPVSETPGVCYKQKLNICRQTTVDVYNGEQCEWYAQHALTGLHNLLKSVRPLKVAPMTGYFSLQVI